MPKKGTHYFQASLDMRQPPMTVLAPSDPIYYKHNLRPCFPFSVFRLLQYKDIETWLNDERFLKVNALKNQCELVL